MMYTGWLSVNYVFFHGRFWSLSNEYVVFWCSCLIVINYWLIWFLQRAVNEIFVRVVQVCWQSLFIQRYFTKKLISNRLSILADENARNDHIFSAGRNMAFEPPIDIRNIRYHIPDRIQFLILFLLMWAVLLYRWATRFQPLEVSYRAEFFTFCAQTRLLAFSPHTRGTSWSPSRTKDAVAVCIPIPFTRTVRVKKCLYISCSDWELLNLTSRVFSADRSVTRQPQIALISILGNNIVPK